MVHYVALISLHGGYCVATRGQPAVTTRFLVLIPPMQSIPSEFLSRPNPTHILTLGA